MRSGFEPRPRQTHIRYALNNIQFISDESSAELVLYLCEFNKVLGTINSLKNNPFTHV